MRLLRPKLPKHVGMVFDSNFRYESGTNCWNATKYYFEPNAPIQHTYQSEMVSWLTANTVEISESQVSIGDIAVYTRGPIEASDGNVGGYGLVHTAVVLSKSLKMFHKRGVRGDYEIVSIKTVNEVYTRPYNATLTWRRFVSAESKAA